MRERLSEPLRLALVELSGIQSSLRQPLTDASHLEDIWGRISALLRQLSALEAQLSRPQDRAVLLRCQETLRGLAAALEPSRDERRATRALDEAIQIFETQVNRPSAEITTPAQVAKLLKTLEQLRWKLDAIPASEDPSSPRAQALQSLSEAMDFARHKLELRAADLESSGRAEAAEAALSRIVAGAGDLDDPRSIAKLLERLDALERGLETTLPSLAAGRAFDAVDRVGRSILDLRRQLREIVEGREAARVIRSAIHGYNAATKSLERGPTTPALAQNLRAHFQAMAGSLDGVRANAMPETLRIQHREIEGAIRALLDEI